VAAPEVESYRVTSSETLIITTPRRNIVLVIAVCLVGLALGLLFISQSKDAIMTIWSVIGIMLLAFGLILGAFQLRAPVRLILTNERFVLTGLIGVSIPWHEVEQFFVYSEEPDSEGYGHVYPHASWRLKEGAPSANGKVAILHHKGGMSIHGSLPRNIGMTPEDLAALMEEWRQRHAAD